MSHIFYDGHSRGSIVNEKVNEGFHLHGVNDHIETHWNVVNEAVKLQR